jgi:hypothetical protein
VGGLGVDVEIILKGIFKKYNGTVWNGFILAHDREEKR